MTDPILEGLLEANLRDASALNQASDCVHLVPEPKSGSLPRVFHGTFSGMQYFERRPDGVFSRCDHPLSFALEFADDYCKSVDPNLQFRVITTEPRLVHPNVSGPAVCLGNRFRPSTSLRSVVAQFHAMVSGRVAAIDHPFDPLAADFFLDHLEEVRGLRSRPLERRPVSSGITVVALESRDAASRTNSGVA